MLTFHSFWSPILPPYPPGLEACNGGNNAELHGAPTLYRVSDSSCWLSCETGYTLDSSKPAPGVCVKTAWIYFSTRYLHPFLFGHLWQSFGFRHLPFLKAPGNQSFISALTTYTPVKSWLNTGFARRFLHVGSRCKRPRNPRGLPTR